MSLDLSKDQLRALYRALCDRMEALNKKGQKRTVPEQAEFRLSIDLRELLEKEMGTEEVVKAIDIIRDDAKDFR